MATFISKSPSDTHALGEQWGKTARDPWLIGIHGDLGAGKTHLVKGIAQGLEIPRKIQSPTFSLVNEYFDGRVPFFHLDFYRLDTPEQIIRAGLDQYLFDPQGVVAVEWIERYFPEKAAFEKFCRDELSFSFRNVYIETLGPEERCIHYDDFGP